MRIEAPDELVRLALERGYDPEILVVEALLERLEARPCENPRLYAIAAEHLLGSARRALGEGGVEQACARLYAAAVYAIEALACIRNVPEARGAKEVGWTEVLVARAARRLAREGEGRILEAWLHANDLLLHCAYAGVYAPEDVRDSLVAIEELVKYAVSVSTEH